METTDWVFFQPNYEKIYSILIFDDGNQKYQLYENQWVISGIWMGKYALINRLNPEIKIPSISAWKLIKCGPSTMPV
jgi:hypothetical protein